MCNLGKGPSWHGGSTQCLELQTTAHPGDVWWRLSRSVLGDKCQRSCCVRPLQQRLIAPPEPMPVLGPDKVTYCTFAPWYLHLCSATAHGGQRAAGCSTWWPYLPYCRPFKWNSNGLILLSSSMTLAHLKPSGKSSSTTITSEIIANGGTALEASSTNVSPTRPGASCGSTRKCSIEEEGRKEGSVWPPDGLI